MKTILVLGAGRSSSSLIRYLLHNAATFQWKIAVGDVAEQNAIEKIGGHAHGHFVPFDINDDAGSFETIRSADVVISLLPASMHVQVAHHCLALKKHLLTASYVSPEMRAFDPPARKEGLLFLNECGLDPGIDHMSAVQIMDRITLAGGTIESFHSFTGGLIAPQTDPENPWRYKFTWNPRNVVMAGQGVAKYLEDGTLKYIPYQQLFSRTTKVTVPGLGDFEGYANRDSLQYIDTYGLKDIRTMLRGTLRCQGFCEAWNILVQLGCCDDTFKVQGVGEMSHREFMESFVANGKGSLQDRILRHLNLPGTSDAIKKLEWSGFFSDEPIGVSPASPAQVVEHILNKKWKLAPDDRDLIVMWHRFVYTIGGKRREVQASLSCIGKSSEYTAMSQTVGLPLGIAAKLILTSNIKCVGVQIPIMREIYEPVLTELKSLGIELSEQESE